MDNVATFMTFSGQYGSKALYWATDTRYQHNYIIVVAPLWIDTRSVSMTMTRSLPARVIHRWRYTKGKFICRSIKYRAEGYFRVDVKPCQSVFLVQLVVHPFFFPRQRRMEVFACHAREAIERTLRLLKSDKKKTRKIARHQSTSIGYGWLIRYTKQKMGLQSYPVKISFSSPPTC